jgi:hypothetical protein
MMAPVRFINTNEMKYQPYEEIMAQYEGYCVCIVRCDAKKSGRIFGGEVFAIGNSVSDLLKATLDITEDENMGEVAYPSFKRFGDVSAASVLQVVELHD